MSTNANVIELNLRTPEQLFNSLDPSPFHERDLDGEAERYIVGWARELREPGVLRLVVTLPAAALGSEVARKIPDAIRNYFVYRAAQDRQNLRELLRIGWRSLAIGIVVLALCFTVIRFLIDEESQTTVERLIEQSLLILGWVANWRPLEIFLYEWWPLQRHIRLLRRLARMDVEIRPV